MRTQRRVFEKLSETTKVELASEKIELNVGREAKDLIIEAEKIYNNAKKDAADDILSGAFKMNDGFKKIKQIKFRS